MSTDLTGGSNPGANAAKNIIGIINAAAEAHTAQTELQKQIMLKQVSDKMELQQKAREAIQEKNINYNYVPGGDNSNIANPSGTPMGEILNPGSGIADSGTPSAVASPMPQGNDAFSMAGPASPPTPPPSPTPMLDASAQRPNSPVLNGIVPPAPTTKGSAMPQQPIQAQPTAPSQQYTNLGYQPIEAQQILAERQKNGQSPNFSDTAYVQALNKVKSGTASKDEMAMVNKMNNRTPDGVAIPPPGQPAVGGTKPSSQDTALRTIEQRLGYPEGSLWRNPTTMAPELSPIWKSKMEAEQRARANYDVNQPFREDKRQDALENKYADRLSKIVSFRSGSLGVQDGKVNSGIHALNLLDQTYDPQSKTFNIPPIMQAELAANVNNAISNQNVTSDSMRQDLMQRSIYGDWNKTMQYLLNTPKNSLPQDNAKLLAQTIIRQGPVAERERDKDMQDLKDEVPSGLDPERAAHLEKIQFGNSFVKELGKAQFYKDLFANDPKYKDIVNGGGNVDTQQFTVGGTTYNIPNDKVEAFKKAKGL